MLSFSRHRKFFSLGLLTALALSAAMFLFIKSGGCFFERKTGVDLTLYLVLGSLIVFSFLSFGAGVIIGKKRNCCQTPEDKNRIDNTISFFIYGLEVALAFFLVVSFLMLAAVFGRVVAEFFGYASRGYGVGNIIINNDLSLIMAIILFLDSLIIRTFFLLFRHDFLDQRLLAITVSFLFLGLSLFLSYLSFQIFIRKSKVFLGYFWAVKSYWQNKK